MHRFPFAVLSMIAVLAMAVCGCAADSGTAGVSAADDEAGSVSADPAAQAAVSAEADTTSADAVTGSAAEAADSSMEETSASQKETSESAAAAVTFDEEAAKKADDAEKALGTYEPDLPDGPVPSDLAVEAIPDLSPDFICGMDASSALAEENSGVRYFNEDGQEQDLFRIFADAGVNYIRLRVWNDPYDDEGHGYGGGNNDAETAITLGKRATANGMKVCIDFHYSDFWADPKKQFAPKAWEGMSVDEKAQALHDFTADSLSQILEAGVDVSMVQVGNEINYGMSGEKSGSSQYQLMEAGCRAVREVSEKYGRDLQIVIHYTEIDHPGNLYVLVNRLNEKGLDYDIIGLSYYPFWDGSLDNLSDVITKITTDYGKKVVVAETSYAYTDKDGDGTANSFSGSDAVEGYPLCAEGQAKMIRDICAAASGAGALGVFYWEGAWIPVGPTKAANTPVWEKYGSGWASSYAGSYDPDDAGRYYGGSSWDNQAFFDFEGHPLPSLSVWKYLRYGSTAQQ